MIEKYVYNEEYRTFSFEPQLASGETILSATLNVIDTATGTDVSATMVSGSLSISGGNAVAYKLVGGTAGKYYSRIFKVVTSAGQKLEAVADMLMVIP